MGGCEKAKNQNQVWEQSFIRGHTTFKTGTKPSHLMSQNTNWASLSNFPKITQAMNDGDRIWKLKWQQLKAHALYCTYEIEKNTRFILKEST